MFIDIFFEIFLEETIKMFTNVETLIPSEIGIY